MNISKHIRDYLSENPSVVVPGLGRFTAVNKPSEIRDNEVIPPRRTVEYDSTFDEDDGVLTAYVAQRENIAPEQAKVEMTDFYNQLKYKLAGRKTIMLDMFGSLWVNDAGDIVFEPDANLFIEREDSYGLGKVNLEGNLGSGTVTADSVASGSPAPDKTETFGETKPASDDAGLFASGNMRVRENTERRRPAAERSEPPVKPVRPESITPPSKYGTKKKTTSSSSGGFPVWILVVLLIAAGLGVGGYFLYPKLSSSATVAQIEGEDETQPVIEEEQDPSDVNPEVAQTLDKSTEKKNALSPGGETSSAAAQPVTQPTKQVETKPVNVSHPAGSIGQGRYLLIVGSFTTHSRAEKFGQSLQNAGINYEIIDFGNERVRIAVAAYDDKTEAFNEANRFKSKPLCENVWVLRR